MAVTVRLRSVGGFLRNLFPYVSLSDHGPAWIFHVNRDEGAHALRLAARYQCMCSVRRSRFHSEGVASVDLDASSHRTWSSWRLTLSCQHKLLLVVFRGVLDVQICALKNTCCPFCGVEDASMRHFWADCPEFAANRRELERRFIICSRWWRAQSRITAKSGWITFNADDNPHRRASVQVPTCELGLSIMLRLQCHDRLD